MNGQVINDIYDKVNDEMERLSMTADYKLCWKQYGTIYEA